MGWVDVRKWREARVARGSRGRVSDGCATAATPLNAGQRQSVAPHRHAARAGLVATCLVAMLGGAGPAHAEPAIAGFSIAPLSNEPIFGKASVGASSDTFARDLKRVNRYSLATNVSVTNS